MLEARITIEAPELVIAVNNLASAIREAAQVPTGAHVTNVVNGGAPAPTAAQPPVNAAAPAPAQPATSNPAVPVQPAPSAAVPLAQPPQYTVDQIMAAGAQLMDAGKVNELINLLHSFGVQAVMDLKPEQLGPFATAMRELGAKI